ncbi:hypothetical protein GTA08_BOTSDO13115 [Neofusicoccum parvum]|uniref:Uncharacterized protein n=1 Tax=Neofusicoccum parvum TaxID=310453 RepID=A0ACB5S9V5_9PEZI|nr:hypothetical protein GTA08_BOTSDO13115 [Neofusicoccum parvum]
MASSRSPEPSPTVSTDGLRDLLDNALCCAQWGSDAGQVGRLGCTLPAAPSRVFCKVGFDRTKRAVLFRLCVPVALKTSGRKVPLYICIEPQKISHLQTLPVDGSEATQACVSDLLANSQQCSSSTDIIILQFLLKQPATIVGPKETSSFEPRSDAAGRILEALRSLSLATDLTLYLPKTDALVECIDELCTLASNGSLCSAPQAFGISALYHGAGGMDVGALLSPSESRHQPPAYQDIARTSELSTVRPTAGSVSSKDRAWKRSIEQQLLDLGESLALLRDEVADMRKERDRERSTPLDLPRTRAVTRSVSALPEFAATAQRLDVVEHHLQRMHRRLGAIEDGVREADDNCRDRLDERDGELEDRQDDFFTDVNDTIEAKLDDWLLDRKADLQNFIKDEMNNVEENIREDLRNAL